MAPHFETKIYCDAGDWKDHGFEHGSDGPDAEKAHRRAEAWAKENGETIREGRDLFGLPCKKLPNEYPVTEAEEQP